MRHFLRLAAVAIFAPLVVACGAGSHALPGTPGTQAGTQSVDTVPTTVTRGVAVTVHLPLRNSDTLDKLIAAQGDAHSTDYRKFLTPQQFRSQFGPAASDLTAVASSLKSMGFTTAVTSQGVIASAPEATVANTFAVHFQHTASALRKGHSTLALDRKPTLPASLARVNATVSFGSFSYHNNMAKVSKTPFTATPDNRYSNVGPYWFDDLKQAYEYPAYQTANGGGRTIAIVMDSDVQDSDTAMYFGHEGLPAPPVQRVYVDGGQPFNANSGDSFEASLDVQMSLGSAPGAKAILYDIAGLDDQSILDGYTAVVEDNRADIVNSSFGGCELYYTAAYNGGTDYTWILQQFHDVFRQGNAEGISFVASSGDNGAYDCFDPTGTFTVKGVENPADDTDVTGVGGTNLITQTSTSSLTSRYVSQNADEDTFDPAQGYPPNYSWGSGGGVSVVFPKPLYQFAVNTGAATRTVPDVAMHMGGCPEGSIQPCNPNRSSVVTAVGGEYWLLIGTSASSPEFAGLLAVTEQNLNTRLGNANNYIYLLSALAGNAAYRQDIHGNNGYPATPGYNYVLGNGTPHAAVFAAMPLAPRAGNPQTPSNP